MFMIIVTAASCMKQDGGQARKTSRLVLAWAQLVTGGIMTAAIDLTGLAPRSPGEGSCGLQCSMKSTQQTGWHEHVRADQGLSPLERIQHPLSQV